MIAANPAASNENTMNSQIAKVTITVFEKYTITELLKMIRLFSNLIHTVTVLWSYPLHIGS